METSNQIDVDVEKLPFFPLTHTYTPTHTPNHAKSPRAGFFPLLDDFIKTLLILYLVNSSGFI